MSRRRPRLWRSSVLGGAAIAFVVISLIVIPGAAAQSGAHPATGVGSCTLKGWNPNTDPSDATDLPEGSRPQSYKPDDYNCNGAKFAAPGVEHTKFPQPQNYHVTNKVSTRTTAACGSAVCNQAASQVAQPAAAVNPLSPYFPPFTHFVVLYRENHTFDDYLGDCATTVHDGCNGQVESTNHISSVRTCTRWPNSTRWTIRTPLGRSRRVGPTTGGCSPDSRNRARSSSRTRLRAARSSTGSSREPPEAYLPPAGSTRS